MELFGTVSGFMKDYVMVTRDCDEDIPVMTIYISVCLTKKMIEGKTYREAVIECLEQIEKVALQKIMGE